MKKTDPVKPLPPLSRLRQLLDYEPKTGVFTWTHHAAPKVRGKEAGTVSPQGYIRIWIDGEVYAAGRLAWFMTTGIEPVGDIDHRNRKRNDNRFHNLRDISHQHNTFNQNASKRNKTGLVGVSRHKKTGRWRAQIRVNGKCIHLGLFDTPGEAATAYDDAKKSNHSIKETRHE